MIEKPKSSPVRSLSRMFSFLLVLIILGIGALLFFAFKDLPSYAATVNQKLEQANLAQPSSSDAQSSVLSERADAFFAPASSFKDLAEADLKAYAKLTGVSIASVRADSSANTTGRRGVSVQINGSVSYEKLLQFITAIESNTPHMRVHSLSFERQGAPGTNEVTVNSLKIGVAVRT